jgi:glycosyltransferase involved in cell wall biosynthesis
MRIGLNGWFVDQPQVGSGQYIRHLRSALAAHSDLTSLTFVPPSSQPWGEAGAAPSSPQTWAASGDSLTIPLRPWGSLAKVWFEQVDAPRAARRRVDVLHYPYFASPLIKTVPTVVTIHDLITFLFPEYTTSPFARLYNLLIGRAARRADAIIAVSEHTRQDIIRHLHIPAGRITVIYEAPDEAFRPQAKPAIEAIKRRYGLDHYIFYIGGLNRHKNVAALLRSFALLRQRLAAPRQLVIAGKAHSGNPVVFPDLRRAATDLGLSWSEGGTASQAAVRFLGFVAEEDKPALYSGADLFVYPSLYEGFGFCPLEAMASGAPVVSSRAASLAEIVGDSGLLVEPNDVRALVEAMQAVLGNQSLAVDLRARGLRQAARFSWARAAAQTIAVYRRVCCTVPSIPS